jgi:hypothetical protein
MFKAAAGAILLAIVGTTAEALWRPVADYVISTVGIDLLGSDFTGVEVEADSPPPGSSKRDGCAVRESGDGFSKLPAHSSVDNWKILEAGENVFAKIKDEKGRSFRIFGVRKGAWLVLTLTGKGNGHATIYLESGAQGYYEGYQISNDCHSKVAGAALICPYVLAEGNQDKALLRAPSIEAMQCQPLIPEKGLPATSLSTLTK